MASRPTPSRSEIIGYVRTAILAGPDGMTRWQAVLADIDRDGKVLRDEAALWRTMLLQAIDVAAHLADRAFGADAVGELAQLSVISDLDERKGWLIEPTDDPPPPV